MLNIAFLNILTAVHLSANLGASADVDFDGGVATGLATTFYLVIGQPTGAMCLCCFRV
jgi:hypothetical protein